jgi:RNA polymerase sigma-70 factor (ECF subfamily)
LLLHHSRRDTRTDDTGNLVLLTDQDRGRWNADDIAAGLAALPDLPGPYQLQAAIAAEHATAATAADTNWSRVADLSGQLLDINPSPVIALNRAVAVAEAYGPEAGLPLVDELAPDLHGYYLFHAARADLLRRLKRVDEATVAYQRARDLTNNEAERAFLDGRLAALGDS